MQNGDEALPNISPAGIGQLVKMLEELFNNMVKLDTILHTNTLKYRH